MLWSVGSFAMQVVEFASSNMTHCEVCTSCHGKETNLYICTEAAIEAEVCQLIILEQSDF